MERKAGDAPPVVAIVQTLVTAGRTRHVVSEMRVDNAPFSVFLKELDAAHADLRGLGGAGIPATQKWKDVRDAVRNARRRRQDDRAFIVVNGDESEPATFKDREILLKAPWVTLEGVILAGLLTGATRGWIYIRHEYAEQIAIMRREIARAERLARPRVPCPLSSMD